MQEIGCGNGYFLQRLEKIGFSDVVGIDVVDDAIKDSKSRTTFPVMKMNGHVTDFDDSTFDAIVASHVIEHSPFPKVMIREMKRIAKPDGLLFIEIPIEKVASPGGGHFSIWKEKKEFSDMLLSEKLVIIRDYMGYNSVDSREVEGKENHYVVVCKVIK